MKTTEKLSCEEVLLGGWLPPSWFGEGGAAADLRTRKKRSTKSFNGLKKGDPRVEIFRRRYQQCVAIVAADVKAGRRSWLPFSLDATDHLEGERFFLVQCQILYRELACKQVLGEPLTGEDLIERLIDWWAQGPLYPGHLLNAMKGTSLDLGEEDDDYDD